MKPTIAPCAAVLSAFVWSSTMAMDMQLEGDRLYMSRGIGANDYIKYKEIVKGKEVRTVILSNSPGGSIDAAMGIADDLIERNVTTVVAGRCLSACTFLFLAGKERVFSSRYPLSQSTLGFHSTYGTIGGDQTSGGRARVYAYYKSRLGSSLDNSAISRALGDLSDRNGFVYVYHPKFRADSFICDGSIERECEKLAGKNALSENVITRETLSDVDIPVELLPKNTLFGLDFENFDSVTSVVGKQLLCAQLIANCPAYLERFASRAPERAIAISPSNKKSSSSWDATDKRSAVRRVMYECVSRSESLCHLYAVGDRVTTTLYTVARDLSEKAIDALTERKTTLTLEDAAENHEYPMRGLRIGSYNAPTPEKIEGAREINTREVAEILIGRTKVAFVDLNCGDSTIPTARCIFGGGYAANEPAVDAGIEKHLLLILKDISPDKLTPIAFFSAHSQNWLSANAAYRAAKAGYKVYWYRGGIRAWESKGLPMVPTTPIGAVMPNAG